MNFEMFDTYMKPFLTNYSDNGSSMRKIEKIKILPGVRDAYINDLTKYER